MGLFDRFKKKAEPKKDEAPKPKKKSEKDIATEHGKPYIAIVNLDVDPENLHQGAFELDWNDKFVADLVRAGYMLRPDDKDNEIVDRWFQTICRHVVMETWEQEAAIKREMSSGWVHTNDLGNGRSEIG